MKKPTLMPCCATLLILCIIALASCFAIFNHSLDGASPKKITKYINKNYAALEMLIAEDNATKVALLESTENSDIVESIHNHEYNGEQITEFSCKSFFRSNYTSGFYHSKNNTPYAFKLPTEELSQIKPNEWRWNDTKDKRRYIRIEKIRENWFYYYMFRL